MYVEMYPVLIIDTVCVYIYIIIYIHVYINIVIVMTKFLLAKNFADGS